MQVPLLEAVGVSHSFGALAVLDRVDFAMGEGDAVGMVGPNGAGKTTLLSILSGSLHPLSGEVRYRGTTVTASSADKRCRFGIARTHQVPKPFSGMTVFENVMVGTTFGAGAHGSDAHRVAVDALETTNLLEQANRGAESLNLLDRKRLELARALATRPAVLLLDEIGGGLTDAEADELVSVIREIRNRGTALIWIEHIVHVLVQAIDRLLCLDGGRVIADGPPNEVLANAAVVDAYLGSGRP